MPHDNNVEIRGFIDNQPFSRYQWLILALCFLAVALDGFDTAIIGFIATSNRRASARAARCTCRHRQVSRTISVAENGSESTFDIIG